MQEPEIPTSAPRLTIGGRVYVLHERTWLSKKNEPRRAIALSEVVPSRYDATLKPLGFRRAFPQRIQIQFETLDEWREFVQQLAPHIGGHVVVNGTKPSRVRA